MKKIIPALIAATQLAFSGVAVALPEAASLEAAMPIAKAENRTILLELTGKDWCPGCIYLKGKILDSDVLTQAVGHQYILVEIDYPRDPKKIAAIPEDELKAREDILTSFKVRGLPCVIYMDADGLPFAVVSAYTRTPEEYVSTIMSKAEAVRTARDAALAHAATLRGTEKAKALVAALELLPETCRSAYKSVLAEIRTLDPEDSLGYAGVETRAQHELDQLNAWETKVREYFRSLPGAPTDPDNVASVIVMCEEYLKQDDLLPEIQQKVLKLMSESYAFQRNIPMIYATMARALHAAPDSAEAGGIRKALEHYDTFLLKEMKLEEEARKAAAPYLPLPPATE